SYCPHCPKECYTDFQRGGDTMDTVQPQDPYSRRASAMPRVTLEFLTEQLALGDELRRRRSQMFHPQDLPGQYGRVVQAIDHLLQATGGEAVVGDGWAVWHHGFVARITQDIDIALPAAQVEEFLRVASVSGFTLLPQAKGRWPKVLHKETGITVNLLPEGARPG